MVTQPRHTGSARPPLTVYKASAGSGKTFTLATRYISLVVRNPMCYRNILAVTFTNKATEEMKMRILSQLYGIWKQLPDSENYLTHIVEDTGLAPDVVIQRAGQALNLLLHNYNDFHVETIDSFFQRILRNLARELNLTANLHIGLNDIQVEEQAVDELIDSLTRQDAVLQWLMKYILETIGDNRSWNIIGQVKKFGRTIFRDYYKAHSRQLNARMAQDGFFDSYIGQLRQLRQHALTTMSSLGEQFFDILSEERLTIEDISYGRNGVCAFFLKLQNGQFDERIEGRRVADCMDDASKWYSRKNPHGEHIHALAETVLMPLLRQALEQRSSQWRLYKSADLTLRHMNQLRLLESIEQRVRLLNDESDRFLLSDTQQLLGSLISDSDSPFIFEKCGTNLEYIMIDEFQDTSTVQWQNFKLLLQECMSHTGSENLIVGDVKQSIYRWRSGDWRLLNGIESQFPHPDEVLEVKPLTVNYRSERNIIAFNNHFFTEAAKLEQAALSDENPGGALQLQSAYADVVQQIPQGKPAEGLVSIRLLPHDDYQEQMLSQTADTIRMLTHSGAAPEKIAILVRSNRFIPMLADYLAAQLPDVAIVSDEAFRLDASSAVCLLINCMRLLDNPENLLAKAAVVRIYQYDVLGATVPRSEMFIAPRPLDELLPADFTDHIQELTRLSLNELAGQLYRIFQLNRLDTQGAYVSAFFDQLAKYTNEQPSGLESFLDLWDTELCSKTVGCSETSGLRILSIHKSKGLEFDNVIIPFGDWRLEHPDILWCHPSASPFDALPVVPVDYSGRQMVGTVYEHDYLDEHLQIVVDNLNLLYVAFTRASRNLFVLGRRNAANTRSALIEKVLTTTEFPDSQLEGTDNEEATLAFTYGRLSVAKESGKKDALSSNVFMQPSEILHVTVEDFASKAEFRQSNKSREFIVSNSPSGEDDDASRSNTYIKIGNVLHHVFSTIHTQQDVERALLDLRQQGILYDNEVTAEKVTDMLRKRLNSPQVADWFSGRWQLFNECSILSTDSNGRLQERRPDRVMTNGSETHVVDFKFGRPRTEYHQQVQEYMQLLRSMGMPGVKGWLWYVYSNKIEEV